VLPIQLPGHFTRISEPAHKTMQPLVDTLASEIASELETPYALFGHSMGAAIAFDLSQELVRRGQPSPVELFVSARQAPHIPSTRQPIHALPEHQFVAAIRRLGGTPQGVLETREIAAIALPMLRADLELSESYVRELGRPLPFPITAFAGAHDQLCPPIDVRSWSQCTSARFEAHTFDGDHFFLHPFEDAISRIIFERIDDAVGAS
jgi:medium-chain acyl-[acyl-carrier-protein] hydrolase